jgi:hypothetical protein
MRRIQDVAVFIENTAKLEEVKKLLMKHNEEIDDDNFFLLLRSPQYNFVCKWRMDGKWRMGNSDRVKVAIEELEEILNYNQL